MKIDQVRNEIWSLTQADIYLTTGPRTRSAVWNYVHDPVHAGTWGVAGGNIYQHVRDEHLLKSSEPRGES